jgi:hypothetical protein
MPDMTGYDIMIAVKKFFSEKMIQHKMLKEPIYYF